MTPSQSGIARRVVDGWSIRHDPDREAQARAGGWWLDTTIGEAAARLAVEEPDRVLLIDGDVRLTADDLYESARRLADAMRQRGIGRGDVVSFMLPNWHEACVVYLATALIGAVSHPLVTNFRNAELLFMLSDCKSRAIFIPAEFRRVDYRTMMAEVGAQMESPPLVVVLRGDPGDGVGYDQLVAEGSPEATFDPVDPGAVRMILYTSGTTGRPKGVLHTHNTINADIVQLHRFWNRGEDARYLVASPVSHIGGSLYAFEMPLLYRTSAVLMDMWDGAAAARLIEQEQCTHMAGATPFLQHLLDACRASGARLPSLRIFICGGASVPPTLIREATSWFDNCIATRVYGSTEVPTITLGSIDVGDTEHAAETDGKIGAATVIIPAADAEGVGELLAKGPQMLVGYHNIEDEAAAFDEAGYFRMGDLGRIVDEDYVVITGRQKDIIIRNGENISPKEIEDLLTLHPDVAEVSVVGIPSEKTGEMACAVVLPASSARPTCADFAAFLADFGIAKLKFPEHVVFRNDLPRNATGKVLKHVLRDEILADMAGGAA